MFKHRTFKTILWLWLLTGLACNFINPAEEIPTYIKIDSVRVVTDYNTEGTAANKIKDIWAYMDGKLIGVYELPAKFPVIGDAGMHNFLFAPGIYDNGIASTHIIYRLMKGYTTDINLVNGETVSPASTPVITYFPSPPTTFSWMEDFESGSLHILHISGASLDQNNTNVFEGAHSGKVSLRDTLPSFRFEMFDSVPIPTTSVTYLEMNYKCDQPFFVGLKGYRSSGSSVEAIVILINPSDTWNKVYVNLGTAVRALNPSTNYKLFFYSSLSSGVTSGTFYFDNFKLVHN